jgi:predicted AAA+ superfamily ATPase
MTEQSPTARKLKNSLPSHLNIYLPLPILKDAYLFYECSRYDLRGKQRLRNIPKYYVVDTGLRNNEPLENL